MEKLLEQLKQFEGEDVQISIVGECSMRPVILHKCEISSEKIKNNEYILIDDENDFPIKINKELIENAERTYCGDEILHLKNGINYKITQSLVS